MNANAIKKVNHFGKAGKIVMTILLIACNPCYTCKRRGYDLYCDTS